MNKQQRQGFYYALVAVFVNLVVWHFVVVSLASATILKLAFYLIIVFIANGWLGKKMLGDKK